MNTANIKAYAPKARRDFIQAVTEKAHLLGLSEDHVELVEIKGDVAIIAGRPYPKRIGDLRQQLLERINREGFELVMRAMAYTWFNRFVAIRYMELHDYLEHGFRVLSNRTGSEIPEIVEHATDVELQGLNKEEVVRLRLAGDKDNELYQLLIVAQCNALSQAMPFLFERIGGYDELLMPDNLLHSNSPVRNLVNEIPEEDWQQIEIIGWIYQFYISEKKAEVIGKVVASVDIPAATQLFTPNWIVKYMVQNSLGAQWLATYPDSKLKEQMNYYIEPAEQTEEVRAQLAAITPSTLNPEELTLIDPASGSGHILVEVYDLFKAIYLERGYRQRDVAQLILEKNLYGLDIDGRAAQLTGFALMMKGRADDRRLFVRGVKLNVMALVDSSGFDAVQLAKGVKLADYGLQPSDLSELKDIFEHATTFGSLIRVPERLVAKLPALKKLSEATSHMFVSDALNRLGPLVQQAELLAAQYDAVVANPPYMGSGGMNALVKKFTKDHFPDSKSDLFACFIERAIEQTKEHGRVGIVAPYVWMFLSSYERFREKIVDETSLSSLIQLEYNAFEPACIPVATFALMRCHVSSFTGSYVKLSEFKGHQNQAPRALEAINNAYCGWLFKAKPDEFKKIPGSPMAYWASERVHEIFSEGKSLDSFASIGKGLDTGDNNRFLRRWYENPQESDWVPCMKGGPFRKWYGNQEYAVYWKNDGAALRAFDGSNLRNAHNYFKPGITWTRVSSSSTAFRIFDEGFIFESTGPCIFSGSIDQRLLIAYLNSKLTSTYLKCLAPTLDFQSGHISAIPIMTRTLGEHASYDIADSCIEISRSDWDAYERSWDFHAHPILTASSEPLPLATLESSYTTWITKNRETIAEMKRLEEENNRLFIDAYGLAGELTPDVPIEQITLTVNPAYRYGGQLTEEELWTRFRQDTMKELVSYAIGCMMGRYSLDAPGLIYAHSGNEGFDPSRYTTFPADEDGIIPLTDTEWFDDDAVNRLVEFISKVWDAAHLEENLTFLADNLTPKKNEPSRNTLRRYLCDSFFKDHLQTYKKRPIYWLLSSGKQKAFQCLVYLHRYNESTLSRVRSAYVTPLFGKFNARLEYLQNEREAADTASAMKKFQKEIDVMKKKLAELSTFDDELRHYADKRISLDLDDGVKVNYGKFGNLLAEKKTVTG
ncbi:MAG: BREX-1 system adenine-specific DNA-methyltransferase PglX [Desulfobulbaceae bacterium]|nr:BREX-1 system adenine-specific DNA-methyltransferase PglX [Desulfobulbaceae bacterium]